MKSLILGILCLMSSITLAQSDVSGWLGLETKYDINKDWSIGLETQARTDLRLGRLDALFLSPSVSWQPMKYLEAGISYRLSSVPYSKSTTNRVVANRFSGELTFRNIEKLFLPKKTRVEFSLRLRGTSEHEAEKRTENTLRLKFKVDYNLPKTKLDLFASTEVFYRFQRDLVYSFSEVQSINAVNKYRVKLGVSHPVGENHSVKLYGLHHWRYPDGTNEFIIGLGYSYKFKSK